MSVHQNNSNSGKYSEFDLFALVKIFIFCSVRVSSQFINDVFQSIHPQYLQGLNGKSTRLALAYMLARHEVTLCIFFSEWGYFFSVLNLYLRKSCQCSL